MNPPAVLPRGAVPGLSTRLLPGPPTSLLAAAVVVALVLVQEAAGHARLMEPPSRASMWRLGYDNPPDFNDHQVPFNPFFCLLYF